MPITLRTPLNAPPAIRVTLPSRDINTTHNRRRPKVTSSPCCPSASVAQRRIFRHLYTLEAVVDRNAR